MYCSVCGDGEVWQHSLFPLCPQHSNGRNVSRVFTLVRPYVCAGLERAGYESSVFFIAGSAAELTTLIRMFNEGIPDERIVIQELPEAIRDNPKLTPVVSGFVSPDGGDLPFHMFL